MPNGQPAVINGQPTIERLIQRRRRLAAALKDAPEQKRAELQADHDRHVEHLTALRSELLQALEAEENAMVEEGGSMTLSANDTGDMPAELKPA